jgi:uncharacterized protein (TIGR02453 family)
MKIDKSTFKFLKDLKANNYREWFNDNKSRFIEAKTNFEEFIDSLIKEVSKFDPGIAHFTAKDCVFRIYRDVRFSKDKSPYKTHFGAHITSAPKKSEIHTRAGYYIHFEPGASMLAGGAYVPESKWLRAIREKIYTDPKEFKKILNAKQFKEIFGEIEGEKLKRAPKDFPQDHPDIELLKQKSFLATHKLADKIVLSDDVLSHSAKVFKALHPFDAYLNSAV